MLVLDFINVGNGDSILVREMKEGAQRFAMLVDCGHDNLMRDDHAQELDPRSRRIYAGDFLKQQGVDHLDVLLLTHFHRDHVGGLSRVLDAVTVDRLLTPYAPPADALALDPDGDNGLPKAARNLLRCVDMYVQPLRHQGDRIREIVEFPGDRMETLHLTEDLTMDVLFGEPALYPRQKAIYDAAYRGERNGYDLIHWAKSMNVASLRQRLYYLSVIVTMAPLLGLLGTIGGMISAFSVFNVEAGQATAITGGVGEALIATAMGLCVAIMALAVHAYFTQRLENIITDMEQCFSLVEANRKVLAGKAGKVSGAGEAV